MGFPCCSLREKNHVSPLAFDASKGYSFLYLVALFVFFQLPLTKSCKDFQVVKHFYFSLSIKSLLFLRDAVVTFVSEFSPWASLR